MNALSCRHLASLLEEKDGSAAPKVATYAVCPGFCRTDLGRNVEYPWWKRALLSPVFWLIQRTARQGACNLVFACAASDREARRPMLRGRMYRDGALLREANDAVDLLAQQDNAPARLWDLSVSLLEETLGAGLDSK
jgi:NAD(P)-dependent dehydrogenase (short-subunit alcohol dehydrogenase family)